MTQTEKIATYHEFWPFYLKEHSKAETRRWHLAGTSAAMVGVILFALTMHLSFLALALLAGYGPAWAAHFFIEKNRPATFRYPFWSLFSDFRMAAYWAIGSL